MESQEMINLLAGLVGVLGGWMLNTMRQSIRELQRQDLALADKVQTIEVLVAGEYIKKEDFIRLSEALFKKLDGIDQKLDKKADK